MKLDPTNSNGWISLAQCLWKKGFLSESENFFLESLKYEETPLAYQELSMLTRQIYSTQQNNENTNQNEKNNNTSSNNSSDNSNNSTTTTTTANNNDNNVSSSIIEQSINYSKKAIQLDFNNHKSWYIYGNALCMKYFSVSSNLTDLNKAIQAYNKSIQLGGHCNPDLYFNQGNCYLYLQQYQLALESYRQTIRLDPSFTLVNSHIDSIYLYINKVTHLIQNKNHIKYKKLNLIYQNLINYIELHSSSSSESLNTLVEGINHGKKISICLICSVPKIPHLSSLSYLFVDKYQKYGIISIYNLSEETPTPSSDKVITINDPIFIPSIFTINPQIPEEIERVSSLSHSNLTIPVIQVFQLNQIQINGRTLNWNARTKPQFTVDIFDS